MDPQEKSRYLPATERPLACNRCAKTLPHALQLIPTGCAWACTACGDTPITYTHEDMRAMIEAHAKRYAGPATTNVDRPPLVHMEVDVLPAAGGDVITYEGVTLERHVNACGSLPRVGAAFWGHFPSLSPRVAKFKLGTVVAVRSTSADDLR